MRFSLDKLRWYSSCQLFHYPHLTSRESVLWSDYLELNAKFFTRISYDVPVSEGSSPFAFIRKCVDRNWAYLNSLKIDCFAQAPYSYHLFEIKPVMDIKAIGQCQIYENFLKRLYLIDMNIQKHIITRSVSSTLLSAARAFNIDVIVL